MKRILLIGLTLLSMQHIWAQPDSLYLKGNDLYGQASYEEALRLYQQVLEQGRESADLYYNMGNAAFRSHQIGRSILYYEKALKLDPGHEDAMHNLEFVSRYRVDAFEEVPELFIRNWLRALVHLFPEKIWSMLALLFFLLLLLGVLVWLFSSRMVLKKTGFTTAFISLFLFIISLSSGLTRHREIIRPREAIILVPSVVVRSSPSESGTELFILHEGTKIELSEEVSGWRNIRIPDGREGWVNSGDFESI